MEGVMNPEASTDRQPVPLQMQVPLALYKLTSCGEYRVIANQFGQT